ncbi:MAG: alanine--tRNA ligase, partial [Methanomicrobiales archaeon]|nr:alanine--tRNA ligase [Methanomicrobiales archaeon]
VADTIGVPLETLQDMILPVERIYTIADHTRCLAYMLGDCIVPSNVREGYLARLVLRRTLRMMHDLGVDAANLSDLVELQMQAVGQDAFTQERAMVRAIVEKEVERYGQTIARGTRIIQRTAATYLKKHEPLPLKEIITLYDSHGIPPEIVRDVAGKGGVSVDLPDDFYSRVADLHAGNSAREADPYEKFRERVALLPPTKTLYYEQPADMEFEAIVLDYVDGFAVLDQTLFYPEGGGQPSDTGTLVTAESVVRVDLAVKIGHVILHQIRGGVLPRGEKVKGMLDEERRWSLMRHHTATHVLLHACKEVLGSHVHQAGAQKGSESSRLDIRHFKHITPEEIKRIEILANRMVMQDLQVSIRIEDRARAEQKFGFDLYQGGVPPGAEIRVVQVDGEVQACAGTHCRTTGEVGPLKIIRVEHIQDGVERLEFAAGNAAIYYMQHLEEIMSNASGVLSVQPDNLPGAVLRFFTEWKERAKEIERLRERLIDLETKERLGNAETIDGEKVVVATIKDSGHRELVLLAGTITERGATAVLTGVQGESVAIVVATKNPCLDALRIGSSIWTPLGGKGGGNERLAQGSGKLTERFDAALREGTRTIHELLTSA